MQQAIEAGLEALKGVGEDLRAALLSEAAAADVIAQVAAVEAGLAGIARTAADRRSFDAAERFDDLRSALSCIAAHLAREDRRAALEALDAGSFPRALAALEAHMTLSAPVTPQEAGAEVAA